jgi:hypothetical protein
VAWQFLLLPATLDYIAFYVVISKRQLCHGISEVILTNYAVQFTRIRESQPTPKIALIQTDIPYLLQFYGNVSIHMQLVILC